MSWAIQLSDADISSQTLAYTVPSTYEARLTVEFTNRSTSAASTVSLWVVPSGEGVGTQHIKESGTTLGLAGTRQGVLVRKIIAPAGAKVYVQASTANVSCQVSGDVTSPDNTASALSTAITAGTTFVQTGTGAVDRTYLSKLRDIKSKDDYSTFANYAASAESGYFFGQNGGITHRLADRLLVGGAVQNDGIFPNVAKDWLTTFQEAAGLGSGSLVSAQFASLNSGVTNDTGGFGVLGGIRSQYFSSAGTAAIGVCGIAVNNNATYSTDAWGLYAEAHKMTAASGSCYGAEFNTRTLSAASTPTPFTLGTVIGLQLAAGCGLLQVAPDGTQLDASAALQIAANPMQFKVGINFMADSIDGTDGVTGTANAMALAKGHIIQWFNSASAGVGSIYSSCATAANATGIQFTDSGLAFTNAAGSPLGYFFPIASAVNYPVFSAAVTGSPVEILASGTDANIDLKLSTTGTGVLRFGTRTALGAETVTGYITIKDSGGTTRKLAVVS